MVGEISKDTLEAILDALQIEYTIIDAEDSLVGWNREGYRMFTRKPERLGKSVIGCHPEKSQPVVERLLSEMKQGERETAEFWVNKKAEYRKKKDKIYILYQALRDPEGNYIGCAEIALNAGYLRSLKGEKRELD